MNNSDFVRALFDPDLDVAGEIIVPDRDTAQRRFNVYRNNVISGLIDALEIAFPAIKALIGSQNFYNIAGLYCRAFPPKSPILQQYGFDFDEFLRNFEPLQKFPYLADVAGIEICLRQSYHAQNHGHGAADKLRQISAENIATVRLELSPAVQFVSSEYPIFDIWTKAHVSNHPVGFQAQSVMIVRPQFDPFPYLISGSELAFYQALVAGRPLGHAATAAQSADAKFDLTSALQTLLKHNAISEVRE